MKRKAILATIALITSTAAFTPWQTTDVASAATTSSEEVTSQTCLDQVAAIVAQVGSAAPDGRSLCTATVTVSESAAVRADLSAPEFADARERFAGPVAYYRDWTHTYWGGSMVEIHKGRTWWDGDIAWIATTDGLAGSHSCHVEGSWAIGWVITPFECTWPSAGTSADAFYRFDAGIAFEGSWITLGVGLHYSTNAAGGTTSWQVGG